MPVERLPGMDAMLHQSAVTVVVLTARALVGEDLPAAIERAQRALDVGCMFHPSAWIEKHEALEQDLAMLRAALPLYELGKKLEAMQAVKERSDEAQDD